MLNLSFAKEEETDIILDFIKGIAKYEKMSDDVKATKELLKKNIFEKKYCEVIIAREDKTPIGFALFFHNFSTFIGKPGLYLEDLYILPQYRHKGYGKQIFKKLCSIALERDCGRMEWSCLNWNEPSIKFYESLGAYPMSDWTVHRLTREKIELLAE